MKDIQFPITKTKIEGVDKKFDLADPAERREYFELKAGPEIKKIKNYLRKNTFIAYMLGKKNSGKGTYSKLFIEIMGEDKVAQISIGDIVRKIYSEVVENENKRKKLTDWLGKNYRGYMSVDDAIQALLNKNQQTLLPTEFILALIKREIQSQDKKSLFIDGFPRDLDQISYSLFFRDLIGYRDDPDIFILIDVPTTVIDERIKNRVICPQCHTPRSLKLLATKEVEYEDGKFYLICDNPECKKLRMVAKEGDELGTGPIKDRLELDEKLIKQAYNLCGVPKALLRNSLPSENAFEFVDQYEITPEFNYEWDKQNKKVIVTEKPWMVLDDEGVSSYSLMPAPVVVSMIKQIVAALGL